MTDHELLKLLADQLIDLEKHGLTNTPEYQTLSEEWQDLAHEIVLTQLLS